ncbi:MAG: hypothetical protein GX444_14905 [Myxococcales bacterium]|nr:hypothetical protein [Myxococcales bacterium]
MKRHQWEIVIALAILVGSLLCLAGVAAAQNYMELDPIVVEGQIQRPEASYIIQRANLDFGIIAKKRSFIYKIEESIDGAPF